jgi:hypothetical protein
MRVVEDTGYEQFRTVNEYGGCLTTRDSIPDEGGCQRHDIVRSLR